MISKSDSDLLYGVPAIARHLGLTDRTVYHLHGKGKIPTFKMGKVVCARRSSLAKWLAEQEAAGRPESEGEAGGSEAKRDGEDPGHE